MADYQTIMRALRNAHAAGDTAAAQRLAQMAKAAQAAPPAVAPEDVRDERGVPGGVHTPETQTQTPASTEFGEPGIVRGTNAFLSGANRGLGSILDAPVHIANKVSSLVGGDGETFGRGVFTPAMESLGAVREPDPEYPVLERVGENTGAGIGAISGSGLLSTLLRGGSLAPALGNSGAVQTADKVLSGVGNASAQALKNPAALAATETALGATSAAGEYAGGYFGRSVGGDTGEKIGAMVGSLAGGLAPTAIKSGATGLARKNMSRGADEGLTSEQTYDALKKAGIDPSGGLVGNESTARLENTMANVPIVGGKIRNKQSRQTRQFGERVQAIAEDVRGYPSHLPPDPHTIGTKIQNNIAEGMQTISSRIDALEGNLGARAATAKTAVSVGGIKDELASLSAKSTPDQQAILSKAANDLDAMRDVPLDAKLHETLMGQRKILKQNLRKARTAAMEKPDDVQVLKQEKLMRKNLDDLDAKIDANLGVDYTRMRAWRSEIGAKTQQGGIKGGAMKKTYGATTEAIQGFTDRAGMRADFDDLMAAENELYRRKGNLSEGGDIPFGRKLTEMPTGKDVYDATMRAGVQAPEKLDVVRRNMAPEQWDEVAADTIEHMGRALPGRETAASSFSPETFLTNWNKLSARSKEILAGDAVSALDDLAVAATSFRTRSSAGNPSGSAYSGMSGAFGLGLLTHPVKTVSAMGSAGLVGSAVSSEGFARYLAGKAPDLYKRLAPRLVGQTGRAFAGQTDADENAPLEITVTPKDKRRPQ